jgi:O-acetyl-ADP-ribose deacetylase (regulator of RNase III)
MPVIAYKSGNILDEQAEAIVNTVNCVGIMGRGIAAQFKRVYPENFKRYAAACKNKEVQPGRMFVVRISQLTNPQYIINFPTKRHWKGKSRIEDIVIGLESLGEQIEKLSLKSIAIPPLGCGLGGLDWNEVKPLIQRFCDHYPQINFTIFEPNGAPEVSFMKASAEPAKMTAGRASLIGLMDRYLRGLMDTSVSLLEIHKLMYFTQVSKQPLKLNYIKHHYGPYATNLGHVLEHIEGHFTIGYADGGDSPTKVIKLLPGAIKDAQDFLANDTETINRFRRVADLVDGFESPFGLELLATVHWVATVDGVKDNDQIVNAVHAWNEGKKKFSKRQIELAYAILKQKNWLADIQH